MLVGATDENHIAAFEAQIAHIDIGRNVYPSQVANVYRAVSVRQCGCNCCPLEILFHICCKFYYLQKRMQSYNKYVRMSV